MDSIRIPIDLKNNTNEVVRVKLDQEFESLDVLSLKITSSDAYRRMCSDFGVIVGRVTINNGFGVENAKVSVFVPITADDANRPEITALYPYKDVTDTNELGVRYNLLPRLRNNNPSHRAVGNFPDITDFSQYPVTVEIFEKYYKYTTVTNISGDYMIFGVPLGTQRITMDFDLFDTKSLEITANDLAQQTSLAQAVKDIKTAINNQNINGDISGFIYDGNGNYQVDPVIDISSMPNIFNGTKTINVAPFWGDNNFCDVGITRCDFKIPYVYQPTAIFFGYLNSVSHGYSINKEYKYLKIGDSDEHPEIDAVDTAKGYLTGDLYPYKEPVVVVYKLGKDGVSRERVGVYKCSPDTGIFKIALPMYNDFYTTNEFGDLIPTVDNKIGIATKGYYTFEFYETNEIWYDRREAQGDYYNRILPGFRVPASLFGETELGGWEDIKSSLFQYDIVNKKRKYYTIKSSYNKHKKTDVRDASGTEICFFPQTNPNKINTDTYWNFPIDYRDVPNIENVSIVGSILMPRLFFERPSGVRGFADNWDVEGPVEILNLPDITDYTYNRNVSLYEILLGIGVNKGGLNYGSVYENLFNAQAFMSNGTNVFGQNETWDFGDNSQSQISLTAYALDLKNRDGSTANGFGVQAPYTQAIHPQQSYGAFINSTVNADGVSDFIDISVYDITDELNDLVANKIYSSFMKGDVTEFSTDYGSANHYKANMYNNNFYYFGAGKNQNALKDIENYFYYR
jgi:hypothetical protein